jgi:hypothetical protein
MVGIFWKTEFPARRIPARILLPLSVHFSGWFHCFPRGIRWELRGKIGVYGEFRPFTAFRIFDLEI